MMISSPSASPLAAEREGFDGVSLQIVHVLRPVVAADGAVDCSIEQLRWRKRQLNNRKQAHCAPRGNATQNMNGL
jgi:hypothetical protein